MHQNKNDVLYWPWQQFWADVAWLLKRQRLQREAQEQQEAARADATRNGPAMPGQSPGLPNIHGI